LSYDKPPVQTWVALWHKELTIAVKPHPSSAVFSKPTLPAARPHVVVNREVLAAMLTPRLPHDDRTVEHRSIGNTSQVRSGSDMIRARATKSDNHAGFSERLRMMRPMLAHRSRSSREEMTLHGRILQLEFTGRPQL
jgi:hypothetical protein